MKTHAIPVAAVLLAAGLAGCRTSHKVEAVHEMKPIHITVDVNIKVDRALDDFFSDLDEPAAEASAPETMTHGGEK